MAKDARPALRVYGALALIAFTGAGCRSKHHQEILLEDTTPGMRAALRVNDPAAARQLSKGFFGLTANTWRWTARNFSVVLAVPLGGAGRGGVVFVSFNLPEMEIKAIGPVTLSASIGPTPLGSEKYSAPGDYTFRKDVAPELLSGESVLVDFALDKALPPKAPETRELGLIVTMVGLESR